MTRRSGLHNLVPVALLLICMHMTGLNARPSFERRAFERLRAGNCSTCEAQLQRKVQDLPRLERIKQYIQMTLGRSAMQDEAGPVTSPKPADSEPRPLITTDKPEVKVPIDEIRTYSDPAPTDSGDEARVLTFRLQGGSNPNHVEAVGVSLLLYVQRRRKARNGNKGKKILLEVSKFNDDKTVGKGKEILTYLRTRVRRSSWQKITLPLNTAQTLLDSRGTTLNLQVTCIGCGRLVQPVLFKTPKPRRKEGRNLGTSIKRLKRVRHKKQSRRSGNPILVISTRKRD